MSKSINKEDEPSVLEQGSLCASDVTKYASSSCVAAVVISEKEDPIRGHGPVVRAHQVEDNPSTTKSTHKANGIKQADVASDTNTAQATRILPKHRKGVMVGIICCCLLAMIGIVIALVVTLSENVDPESRDASMLTNGVTSEVPSMTPTTVPTASPTISTPVPSFSPSTSPSYNPTETQTFCLEASDACGDAPGLLGFGLGTDWRQLKCQANMGFYLECTIVACNQVFSLATPIRVLYFMSETTNQRVELSRNGFELFDDGKMVFSGTPTIKSQTEVDIQLSIDYFPNLPELQVWLESRFMRPLAPVDRLPNQITLSFDPC